MELLEAVGAFAFSMVVLIGFNSASRWSRDTDLDVEPGEYRNGGAIVGCNVLSYGMVAVEAWKLVQFAALPATIRDVAAVLLCLAGFWVAQFTVTKLRKRNVSDYWVIRYYVKTEPGDPNGPWRRWEDVGLLRSRQEAERALERCRSLKPSYHFGAHRLSRAEWIAFQPELQQAIALK
ncbi:hypothetical protein [Paraburkholderia fungorum]|uniref:hypothetical protein n=1 Tax=Paraburkholderia fungorum TaxID=134537 RepID=UPI00161A91A3|nr:hypothetical protein [Paraburkholderia fungorum]MBB5546537.1 transposase [Paraburkholderia fungorum]